MPVIIDPPLLGQANETLRIAVVADLHAYDHLDKDESAPSHLCTIAPEDQRTQHPIMALIDLIEKTPIRADVLLCCGDMADKARPAGIRYVWEKLQILKTKLDASELFVTSGNHDLDSRHTHNDYDAKGLLQSLLPQYPFAEENLANKYWARNYVVFTGDQYRMVVLNSSAYHGTKDEEYEHGRITPRTVEALRLELEDLENHAPRNVNILVCHHHPHKHDDIEEEDYSVIQGAPKLLQVLGSGQYGNWIVIHGHKHHPRLCYAAGGSSAPVIFSAGSLCAVLYPDLQQVARNQFYLIEFPLAAAQKLGLGLIGSFESWDWVKGMGWVRAGLRSGLPAYGGFGNRGDKGAIVSAVDAAVRARGEPFVKWSEVLGDIPGLNYLLPIDLEWVVAKLGITLNVLRQTDGQIAQIGLKE